MKGSSKTHWLVAGIINRFVVSLAFFLGVLVGAVLLFASVVVIDSSWASNGVDEENSFREKFRIIEENVPHLRKIDQLLIDIGIVKNKSESVNGD